MEEEHAALHMTDVFIVNTSCWCPQAFAFGSEHAAVVPFKALPSLKDWETWTSKGSCWKRLKKVVTGTVLWPYSTGRKSSQKRKRFSFEMFRRAEDDPRAGL
jgi:hypothetical protein